MSKLSKFIKSPLLLFVFLSNRGINLFNDKTYLKIRYFATFKKILNLQTPQTFNEKLQWLKLNDRKDIYTKMVDKYEAKYYVSKIIGNKYIIPTLGIYNNFDEIDFNKLPNQFVIKCTHDSGGLVIVTDKSKLDIKKAKKKINKSLKRNYYYLGREWPYKNVKPRIIVEKYMKDNKDTSMRDYKFFCFNGNPYCILLCNDRNTELKETFFDLNWKILPFKRPNHSIDTNIEKPHNLDKMIEFSKKLSLNIPFLRVDFYEINGNLYFGELTFYPAGGFSKFEPEEWDLKLGNLIDLNLVSKNEK